MYNGKRIEQQLVIISTMIMLPLLFSIFPAIVSSTIVTGPRGPHPVAYNVETLTDETRWDPFAPSESPHKRRILVSIFSPLDRDATDDCQLEDPIPYLPPATAVQWQVVISEALGLPDYLFDGFELQFCQAPSQPPKTEYPVVIFSPGMTVSRLFSSAQAQSLASHGFTVITVDHPYESTVVEFPNGDVVYGFNVTDATDELAEESVGVGEFIFLHSPQLRTRSCLLNHLL